MRCGRRLRVAAKRPHKELAAELLLDRAAGARSQLIDLEVRNRSRRPLAIINVLEAATEIDDLASCVGYLGRGPHHASFVVELSANALACRIQLAKVAVNLLRRSRRCPAVIA